MVSDNKIFFVGLVSLLLFCHCAPNEIVYTELKGSTFGTYYFKYKSAENLEEEGTLKSWHSRKFITEN